jgi:hypothetical protein
MRSIGERWKAALICLLMMCGCQAEPGAPATPTLRPTLAIIPTLTSALSLPTSAATAINYPPFGTPLGLTTQRADGNHLISGIGKLPDAPSIDIPVKGVPLWIIGAKTLSGIVWLVVLEDGQRQFFAISIDGTVREVALDPTQVHPPLTTPPTVFAGPDDSQIIPSIPAAPNASPFTPPMMIGPKWLYVTDKGGLSIDYKTLLDVNALPDTRLLIDEQGRVLILSDPTTAYPHGALGDSIEAGSMTLVSTSPEPTIIRVIGAPKGMVFESIAPIWTDLNGDGQREIIITASDEKHGARIIVYDEAGNILAQSEPLGEGFRWQHVIAAGPFGPKGEMEIASVRSPHIAGTAQFYRMNGTNLDIVAQVPGYASHVINTRNLDMAAAGDIDGDGRIELLTPTQNLKALAAVQHADSGGREIWRISLNATLTSNLAGVTLSDGQMLIGAGLSPGVLRVWGVGSSQ